MKLSANNWAYITSKKIGLETEVPFRYFYPDLYEKYIKGKWFSALANHEKAAFTAEIEEREPELHAKIIQISKELWLGKWKDPYWEYVFWATDNMQEHIMHTQRLIAESIMPEDMPLSLHMTVGEISTERAFALLIFLEKKFATRKRIMEALQQQDYLASWWRKWSGGIVHKSGYQLTGGDAWAKELRTLKIEMNQLESCLLTAKELLDREEKEIVEAARAEIEALWLPWKTWGRKEIFNYGMNGKFETVQ